ncbi:MAG TPA: glycosyltransferase [Bacteroidia bacterium]|nr:glycosyltransferase [Bacteroidia bacterium]
MPKVLRIINRFNLGGPTYNVAYLTKYLQGYETLLVGGEKDDSEDSSTFITSSLGLEPVIIEEMKRKIDPTQDIAAYKKIKNIISEFKPDIVHTHASKAGTLGRLAAFSCKVPKVVHTFHGHVFHSYFGFATTTFYKNIERYLAKRSDAIVAISEKQKMELSKIHKICNPNKITVIPLGFDLLKFNSNIDSKRINFRKKYNIKDDEICIGIIGRLVPVKNHKMFLDAFKKLSEATSKKIKAFIVGDGELKDELITYCQSLQLSYSYIDTPNYNAQVIFTSWIKEVDEVLAGIDVVALTSFNEGTPVSLIEAQACNKPIVTTNVGGIENVVKPNITAILCENNNASDFFNALYRITENEQLRLKMGTDGWMFVKDNFHYTRLCADMKTLYDKLLG